MRIFITGGTGAIGCYAVPALVRAGHEVTALARTTEKAALLRTQGATPAMISIFDAVALREAFAGHDAIVNLATAIPHGSKFLNRAAWTENDRIRIEGSRAVVEAALSAGVARLVQESVSMLYHDNADCWIDEEWPTDTFPMARGNHAAEANANRFSESGRVGVVLRFGWFYGPGARHCEQVFSLAQRHIGVQIGGPQEYVSSIHLADAAQAVLAALAAPSGTFNVVDDEPLTKRDYATALEAAAGHRAWLRLPGRAALLLGDRLTSLTRSLRVSNARFRAATGWKPHYRSARAGWISTANVLDGRRFSVSPAAIGDRLV